MEADIHTLFESDFYRILDFRCRCQHQGVSGEEHSDAFSISFVRKGNFLFHVYRHCLDAFSGGVLLTKPGYERTVSHVHHVPDECTILEFRSSFYEQLKHRYLHSRFFRDNDLHSILLSTRPGTEFLHHRLFHEMQRGPRARLQVDATVLEIAAAVLDTVSGYTPEKPLSLRLKRNHLGTLEDAKAFITTRFTEDVSLQQIAAHCHLSPFHFSRIFSTFTGYTPYQFLLEMRLNQASTLLKQSELPVVDIAYASGFNSLEHFSAAFRHAYGTPPSLYRTLHG